MYGILISAGILASALVAEKLLDSKKDKEKLWTVGLVAVVCGVIGARAYHVINYWIYYAQAPVKILEVWRGGLGIWGAIIGGVIGVWLYLKLTHEPILKWLNLIAVVLPLAQAIGRVGNYFNTELFGIPTNLFWGIYIPPEKRPAQYATFTRFHPLFLYEAALNLMLFALLVRLYKKHSPTLAIYLIGYSVIRFALEALRINPWQIDGLNVAQMTSILVLVASSVFLFVSRKKWYT
jgi:phosphatidylglycerol:prolipoprotein diacylglycerol transferase